MNFLTTPLIDARWLRLALVIAIILMATITARAQTVCLYDSTTPRLLEISPAGTASYFACDEHNRPELEVKGRWLQLAPTVKTFEAIGNGPQAAIRATINPRSGAASATTASTNLSTMIRLKGDFVRYRLPGAKGCPCMQPERRK